MLLCVHTCYINHNHKAHYLNIKALYFAHHCFLTTWFKNISYSNRLSLPRKIFNFIFKHTLCCWIIHSLVHMNGKRHTHYLNKIYSRENTQQGSLGSRGKKKVSRKKSFSFSISLFISKTDNLWTMKKVSVGGGYLEVTAAATYSVSTAT